MSEICNAKITGTMLGLEDHGIFTSYIYLDLSSGGSIGFGGYSLGNKSGIDYIGEILNVVGVDGWEDLKGKYIRVKLAEPYGPISAIGNLMDNKWFDQKEFFDELS